MTRPRWRRATALQDVVGSDACTAAQFPACPDTTASTAPLQLLSQPRERAESERAGECSRSQNGALSSLLLARIAAADVHNAAQPHGSSTLVPRSCAHKVRASVHGSDFTAACHRSAPPFAAVCPFAASFRSSDSGYRYGANFESAGRQSRRGVQERGGEGRNKRQRCQAGAAGGGRNSAPARGDAQQRYALHVHAPCLWFVHGLLPRGHVWRLWRVTAWAA